MISLLWFLIWAFSLSNIWIAVAIGLTQHLIFDQLTNPLKIGGYLLAYRAVNGFKTELIINRKKE